MLHACQSGSEPVVPSDDFDWQGHRGARGLMPENTAPSFLKALEYPVRTLEMDVVISQDSQVVLSHEPWMAALICDKPDGTPVEETEEKSLNIFEMDYAVIREYDCGSRGHERFPRQKPLASRKPLLGELILQVEQYCRDNAREFPFYNIEIKSRPEWDNIYTPEPSVFARLLLREVQQLGIQARTCIQSFDVRALQAVREMDSTIVLALLVENTRGLDKNLEALGFTPDIYSPYHQLVSKNLVSKAHAAGMRVIPWTVNEVATMQGLINMGVDGIITDFPDLIGEILYPYEEPEATEEL